MRILIVDDQRRARDSLHSLLATSLPRLDIAEAADGAEAVRKVGEELPQLVVMDLRMPVLDGIAATRLIKERWPDVKVLALSMYPDREREAREAGADRFVGKGEPPENLLCAVASLL